MINLKKYFIQFILHFFIFLGVLCLFDWNKLDTKTFLSNVLQGFLFGIFMTFYNYWSDKRNEKKSDGDSEEKQE